MSIWGSSTNTYDICSLENMSLCMHPCYTKKNDSASSIGFKFWSIYSWVVVPTLLHCNHLFLYHKNSCGLNSPNFGRQYMNVHGRNNKRPPNHNRTPEMNKIRHRKLVFWMGFYSSGSRRQTTPITPAAKSCNANKSWPGWDSCPHPNHHV